MEEMRQSSFIMSNVIEMLFEFGNKPNENYINDNKVVPPTRP